MLNLVTHVNTIDRLSELSVHLLVSDLVVLHRGLDSLTLALLQLLTIFGVHASEHVFVVLKEIAVAFVDHVSLAMSLNFILLVLIVVAILLAGLLVGCISVPIEPQTHCELFCELFGSGLSQRARSVIMNIFKLFEVVLTLDVFSRQVELLFVVGQDSVARRAVRCFLFVFEVITHEEWLLVRVLSKIFFAVVVVLGEELTMLRELESVVRARVAELSLLAREKLLLVVVL